MNTICSHTFTNTVTGLNMVVYTKGQQSAFSALYSSLKAQHMPIESDWRLVGIQSHKMYDRRTQA